VRRRSRLEIEPKKREALEMPKVKAIGPKDPGRKPIGPMCDQEVVARFDYSRLSADFSKLAKPAQRALLNNGIFSPAELSRRTLKAVSEFHGIEYRRFLFCAKRFESTGLTSRSDWRGTAPPLF
jgi:hypothetical protein